jgi:hypothetical protein
MARFRAALILSTAIASGIAGCGGGSGGGGDMGGGTTLPPALVSYLGTTGVFAAWTDPTGATHSVAPTGHYAGKKQSLRGSSDFLTGASLGQPAGVEVYEYEDGHIYVLDLTSSSQPVAQQLSNESAATVDDTCTLAGAAAVAGANYDYVGVYFTGDLQNTPNTSYFYRLPGPDGVCNTADDVIHLVKTGMSANSAPIVAPSMPVATVRTSLGGISGFVFKSGTDLVLTDSNLANSVTLGTFPAPIGVAVALAVGTTQGYPTGQLYVVDGNIVYVDYVAHSISAALFTIPGWTPAKPGAQFAASPDTLYFAINTPGSSAGPATTNIYAMPANGTAAPVVVDSEAGFVTTLLYPVQGTNLLWGVVDTTYSIRTLAASGGVASTLASSTQNGGTFIATANTVYYTTWAASNTSTTVTRSGTQSGIVGIDGAVIQAPLAHSMFVNGGEQVAFLPNDTATTTTAYETVLQIQGLSPVTLTDQSTGKQYIEDGVGGGSLVALDATSNQVVATVGTLPTSSATGLSGTFRSSMDTGFLEATTPLSTEDPATRDLYLLNSRSSNSLVRGTDNL